MGRARVWGAYLALVQALTSAELVELPPDTHYRHASSAVLLRGSLATSAAHCSIACATASGARHAAQCSVLGGACRCSAGVRAELGPSRSRLLLRFASSPAIAGRADMLASPPVD